MANEKAKILVCDDEADIVSAISIYLRAEGYDLPEDLYTLEELRDAILRLSGKEAE